MTGARPNALAPVARAVVRRPGLWWEAARSAAAMTPRAWWRGPPRLPMPDGRYLAWRAATAYGDGSLSPRREDVAAYLEWRRRQRAAGR